MYLNPIKCDIQREELAQLDTYVDAQKDNIKLQKGDAQHKVSLGASYGYQCENYVFNQDHDIAVAGVTLSWNIFRSGQRRACVQ